jgi:hypothetical protein
VSGYLDDGLNLHRDVEGQLGHPHRRPRPASGITEHRDQQLGAAVEDRWSPVPQALGVTLTSQHGRPDTSSIAPGLGCAFLSRRHNR